MSTLIKNLLRKPKNQIETCPEGIDTYNYNIFNTLRSLRPLREEFFRLVFFSTAHSNIPPGRSNGDGDSPHHIHQFYDSQYQK